jgi:uncharacterized protein (DUF58 family)
MIGAATVTRREHSLRQLELLVVRKLDGLLQGDHQGLVPGAGSEPGDGRLYQPGDDVRRMDWNLTARSGAPHMRTTIADRELETWVVVDSSASLDFGTAQCEKRDLALAASAAFGFLTARDGNRIGGLVYGPEGASILPPRSGREAVYGLLRRLEQRPRSAEGAMPLADALQRVHLAATRRGLIVVVTDLLDDSPWPRQLRALATRHDVVVAEVQDARDAALPAVGMLTLVDPESGQRLEVNTNSKRLRERFEAAAAKQRRDHEQQVRGAGAAHLALCTDRDWVSDVARFVAKRRRRR